MNTTQNTTTNTTAADDAHKVRTLVEELGDLIDDVSTWGPDDEVRMLPKLHKIRAALSAALDADHRPVQELPEWTGAIIEGVDGGRIQATAEGVTYTAAEAIYRDGMWYGAWRTARGGTGIKFSSSSITPGTWKVADQ